MSKLKDRIENALDENRMLVLVVQVLIGFQFKGVYESGFDRLPLFSHRLKLISFALFFITLALLLMTATYHRIVERGQDTHSLHGFITGMMEWALLPFALGIGTDF